MHPTFSPLETSITPAAYGSPSSSSSPSLPRQCEAGAASHPSQTLSPHLSYESYMSYLSYPSYAPHPVAAFAAPQLAKPIPTPAAPAPPIPAPNPHSYPLLPTSHEAHPPAAESPLPCVPPSPAATPFTGPASQNSHSSQPSHLTATLPPPNNEEQSTRNEELLSSITLNGLADLLGSTRATIRHFADRLGFRFTTKRVGARHKRVACLTATQAQAIAAEVERDIQSSSSSSSLPCQSEASDGTPPNDPKIHPSNNPPAEGLLYLLQLEPEKDPGRFKLGFTADLENRLDDLLTAAPYATCIATWPAHRSWERIAIISIAQTATKIREEVFHTEDLPQIIQAGHEFFKVMPGLRGDVSGSAALRGDPEERAKHPSSPTAPLEEPPRPESLDPCASPPPRGGEPASSAPPTSPRENTAGPAAPIAAQTNTPVLAPTAASPTTANSRVPTGALPHPPPLPDPPT